MKSSKQALALVVLGLTLSACDDGKGPGNPDAYQGKEGVNGNECSQQFVGEYNDVARTARYLQSDLTLTDTPTNREQTTSDAQSLKDKATAFKTKYAGVACVAQLDSTGAKETIDVNDRMDMAVKAADSVITRLASAPASGGGSSSARATPPAPAGTEQCSSTFLTDYLAVNKFAKAVSDDLEMADTPANRDRTKSDAQTLKDQAKAFQARHAGYKCEVGSGSSRYSVDVDAKMQDLENAADKVISLMNGGGSTEQAHAVFTQGEPALTPIQVISR